LPAFPWSSAFIAIENLLGISVLLIAPREQEDLQAAFRGTAPPFQDAPDRRHPTRLLWIDYKDVDVLKDFLNENVRIIPPRTTGTKVALRGARTLPTRSGKKDKQTT
jgi:ribosomal protein S18